ncbi:CENP-b protein 1 [Phytophthora cinnamomi]|uniref:CENP-b protein 1 n=1 Tax=Phytophthora cinnamomi TaxID=4785 RepID=UPI003559788B|nr:CENP-b protein 1 [Phytophthora cinnamomi]
MPTKPRTLREGNLTESEKYQIAEKRKREPKMTQVELANWVKTKFNLAKAPVQATISNILRAYKDKPAPTTSATRKTNRAVTYPELDDALALWVHSKQANNIPITDELIQAKGRQLFDALKERGLATKDLSFSAGWLGAFKKRHDFKHIRLHGEAASAASEVAGAFLARVQPKLDQYSPDDVFNFDESGLFYRRAPRDTVGVPDRAARGVKHDKARITVGLATNMTGSSMLEPLFIGHAKKPRAFKKKSAQELGFLHYYANKNAWMTTTIFRHWIQKLNVVMARQDRKILLLIDNAPSHIDVQLTYVEVVFLPPNATAVLQPLDGGIIACFKAHYRRFHLMHALEVADQQQKNWFEVDILTAMKSVATAWSEVSTDTVANCWRKCGFSCNFSTSSSVYPLSVKRSMADSVADIQAAVNALNLTNAVSIDDILNPTGENEVHFAYSDDAVLDLVMPSPENADEEAEEVTNAPDSLLEGAPSDAEFAAAASVVMRRLSSENETTCAVSMTKSFLSKWIFEHNLKKLANKKQELITSHFKPV